MDFENENNFISNKINNNKKNAKKLKFFNNNNCLKYIKKWKPYQYLTIHEKRKLEKEKEKKKNQIFLSTEKFWRNLDFDNKFINLINKPQTPHNTGQFLTHNFNIGNKKIDKNNSIENDDSNSLCVSGSMLNQNGNNFNECPDLDFDFDMNEIDTSKTDNSTYKDHKD